MRAPLPNAQQYICKCECHGSSEITIITDAPCHSRCSTLMNPHCSMAISAEHKLKFAVLHCNSYVPILVKNSRVGRKTRKKQTNVSFVIWTSYAWNNGLAKIYTSTFLHQHPRIHNISRNPLKASMEKVDILKMRPEQIVSHEAIIVAIINICNISTVVMLLIYTVRIHD